MQPELIPNQNSFGTQVGSEQLVVQQQRVLRNTYLLLALSLIPTGIGALIGVNLNFGFMRASPIISSIVLLAVIYGMFFAIEKNRDSGLGVALLLALTLFLGILLGPILQMAIGLRNGGQLVALAAGGTAAVFFAMAGIATVSKRDFGFMTNFLMVGGIVIMLAVVANIFFQSPVMSLAICGAFVLFSSAMILWQVSQIVRGGETNYVSATLTLYMSIYNLFTSLLQLLMALTGNRD
ncbi:MAG TPA: Bax inhibitor-1/YccA family protein [Burkholderiales bacterium]|jgi:modulator of FtsH protease|nr:Bax inhibitor-1/YccA family protein [Burkholderiales bacterium]